MKAYDTAWATQLAVRHLAADGYVASAQNCWPDPMVARVAGAARAVGLVMSRIGVAVWAPGQVERGVEQGRGVGHDVFRVGEHDEAISPRTGELVEMPIGGTPARAGPPRADAASGGRLMGRGFALHAGVATEVIRAAARDAEAAAYGSFWVNYPGPVDGLAALTLAAAETTRIALGVGVIPLHTRGPDSIVAGVRANALPVDRLLLGVGSPNPGALGRVRAGIAALRAHLPARLIVAALGPRMCRLAGEVADGVLFNWLTPEHALVSAEWVRAGAAAGGRPTPRLAAYVRVAVGPAGAAQLEEEGRRYAAIPAYADHFARMGVPPIATAVAAATDAAVPGALAPWERAVDEVVVRAITARDTIDETLALIRAARPT